MTKFLCLHSETIPDRRITKAAAALTLLVLLGCTSSQARSLSAQASGTCHAKMFWFMATTTSSSLEYWRYGTQYGQATPNICTCAYEYCLWSRKNISAPVPRTVNNFPIQVAISCCSEGSVIVGQGKLTQPGTSTIVWRYTGCRQSQST